MEKNNSKEEHPGFQICPMTEDDCPQLSLLCAQLGFNGSPDEMSERFRDMNRFKDHVVMLAKSQTDHKVVGMIHFYGAPSFLSEKTVELGALVIDKDHRRLGLGRLLVGASEKWARHKGYKSLLLATQTHRDDAVKFYHDQGFETELSTYFLRKNLS